MLSSLSKLVLGVFFAAIFALVFSTQANVDSASANAANGGLVPEVPRTDTPQILDGRIRALKQIGTRIVAGGTFTQVSPSAGDPAMSQPYIAAFDRASGDMDMSFLPVVDGDVLVVEPGDTPGTIFIGGRFKTVNGESRKGIAKLDLATGQVVQSFKANTSRLVSEIHLADGKLYVGGDFKKIKGKTRYRLAALDPTTGAVDPDFLMPLGDAPRWPRSPLVRSIEKLSGDRLLVVHRATTIGGLERWGMAILDVSNPAPTVTAWNSDHFKAANKVPVFGVDVSPDGSYFVVTSACADYPPQCDTAVAFPTTGGANVQPLWVTRLHDSTYAVAIADNAVYVGGHFCQTESATAPEPWGGDGARDYSCYSNRFNRENAAMLFGDDIDIRGQIAALSPTTGKTIPGWNPESNARNGVTVLTLVDNGLLLGHDGMYVGGRKTGRVAVIDRNDNRDIDNIAPFASVQASSTHPHFPAKRAVDGTRRGNYAIGFGLQTNSELNPWFDLDFGSIEDLKKVRMFDRTDCCAGLNSNISVFVSDTPFPSTDPIVVAATPGVTEVQLGVAPLSRVTNVGINRSGRYVRIQMVGTGVLQLAEVEVLRAQPADTTPPVATMSAPANGVTVPAGFVTLSGSATDNVKVKKVALSIRNRTTKQYLHSNGTWGSYHQLPVTLTKAPSTPWSITASLPAGNYRVVYRAIDTSGNKQVRIGQNLAVN